MAKHKQIVTKLAISVVFMFCFGFMLVPLYDVFCDITGLNGKTAGAAISEENLAQAVDESRELTILFVASNNAEMPWQFKPMQGAVKVKVGQAKSVAYFARNSAAQTMIAQAVPSVAPARAAEYFHKTECFCFTQQQLAAGEEIEMGLRFIVDQDLPKDIKTITLSYTLFDVTNTVAATN